MWRLFCSYNCNNSRWWWQRESNGTIYAHYTHMIHCIWALRGRATHICVSKVTNIALNNGLPPGRRPAIILTNAGILLSRTLGTNFNGNLSGIYTFSYTAMHFKVSSAKWRQFCLVFKVLIKTALYIMMGTYLADIAVHIYKTQFSCETCYEMGHRLILDTLPRPLRICCLSLGCIWYHPLSSILIRPYILRSILNCHSLSTKRSLNEFHF